MSLYDDFVKGYEAIPYVDGRDDCYGLVRKWMKANYGLSLRNYARPLGFTYEGLNLLHNYFENEGFKIVEVPLNRLEIGDLLLMRVAERDFSNHIAIYVGNNYILHHLYGRKSSADVLDARWKNLVMDVIRNPSVTTSNSDKISKKSLVDFLPPHLKVKYERLDAASVEPTHGEVRLHPFGSDIGGSPKLP